MVDIINSLKRFSILSGSTQEELATIAQAITIKTYPQSEIILQEGENSVELFFLFEGTVIISKKHPTEDESYQLGEITAGHIFGDMNFIEYQTRSASITAKSNCTVGILSKEKLLSYDLGEKIYEKLIKSISNINITRLKQSNNAHVKAIRKEKDQLELRVKFGEFFIITIICFGLAGVVNDLVLNYRIINVYSGLFNWTYLLLLFALILYYIKEYRFNLAGLGLTTKNWQKSIIESVSFSIIFVILCLISAYIYVNYFHGHFNYNKSYFVHLSFFTYIFHSFIQEFIARGVVQTSFQRFFDDAKGNFSILMTSTLFLIFHLHQGLLAGVIAFLASLLLGWMYNRQKNLIGVTILHFVMGAAGHYYGFIA